MKELIEYLAKSIAHDPESVKVIEVEEEGRTIIELAVGDDDKGRIIGKHGRVAQAMRLLLRVVAVKEGTRAVLTIT